MTTEMADVQLMSHSSGNAFELVDAVELASRLKVPVSWVRSHSRTRTPNEDRIPCIRLGRYVRFEWGSPRLIEWLLKKRE
jgi:hypothetical protein